MSLDPAAILSTPGIHVSPGGGVTLSGPAAALLTEIEALITRASARLRPERVDQVPLMPVAHLRALDYFSSFPHLATFPVSAADEEACRALATANASSSATSLDMPITLGPLAEVRSVLAPAACYHIYPAFEGTAFEAPRNFSTTGACFRHETHEDPLRRQRCFRMREVVHVGNAPSVKVFLSTAEAIIGEVAAALGLDFVFEVATDPFFDPARSPKFMHQKLFPTKREAMTDGLAFASVNSHRSFFGETFDLRVGGEIAHTACLAFGLERWVHAVLSRHGTDPARWPRTARSNGT